MIFINMNKFIVSIFPSIAIALVNYTATKNIEVSIYAVCLFYMYHVLVFHLNEKLMEIRTDIRCEIDALEEKIKNK